MHREDLFIVKKSQEGTKDCLREPPNMLQVSLLIRYPNHKFSNYNLTDLNKIILIVRYVIDVNFGYLCLYSTKLHCSGPNIFKK